LLMIDVVVLACLYGLRVVAGGLAVSVQPSAWLTAFCVFFFLALALVKRSDELKTSTEAAGLQLPGRGYRAEDLDSVQALASAAGFSSAVVLAFYVNSDAVRSLYGQPFMLWGIALIVIAWIGRVILIAGRGQIGGDPVVFAVTDGFSLLCAAAGALIF